MAKTIKLKRIYEAPAASDGARILVDRLWPRGIAKDKAKVDLWLKVIAPSTSQMTKSQNGEPTDFAIPAGVRKIPTAMTCPINNAIAVQSPNCRFKFSAGCIRNWSILANHRLKKKLAAD